MCPGLTFFFFIITLRHTSTAMPQTDNRNLPVPSLESRFKSRLPFFRNLYNPAELMKKIGKVAKKAGASTVYHILLLYYALANKNIPLAKRMTVMAALGYFILPFDFLPDMLPAGLADDGAILLYALNSISAYIDDSVRAKARARLHDWFGPVDVYDFT